MEHLDRGFDYIALDLNTCKLFVFANGSFANNKDLSFQLGFLIFLANEMRGSSFFELAGNIVHWSSTKCKRITRSVLASEIYGMMNGVNTGIALAIILRLIIDQLRLPEILLIICTDFYSLYECIVKLGTTQEKRLMIDVIFLRQSYERRKITEIRWIHNQDNPANALTKAATNRAMERLMSSNKLNVRMEGYVKKARKKKDSAAPNV
jgi:hypothetical protein